MIELFVFGLPMTACAVGLVWFEVAKVRALKALGMAAIEAEKQVQIAKAQASQPATPAEGRPRAGASDGGRDAGA